MYPDDSDKDLAVVLSYLAGRTLSREEIWTALGLRRSTYYDQLEKGKLISADNLRRAATSLGINRAELLTRYRLIDPDEVTALAELIHGYGAGPSTAVDTDVMVSTRKLKKLSEMQPRVDAPPV
ncbi:hypothetical protein ACAG26_22625 [Mycobacterium sp. pUA109]|uniref:hypothetical protein n=1 Tax=Mycobacterium sp. pUA109 TaxID=3238982 RepID=UPI00351BE4F6